MWLGKRLFDIFFSLLGLIFLSPFFIFIAIMIKLDDGGPIFFRQQRVGRFEKLFFIHKFRTMSLDADKHGLQITIENDPRITKIGHLLRKFKLDEFPQLIDVFLGTMSLVGPRPEVPKYVEKYSIASRQKVFQMRPGITDWASIKYKNESAILGESTDPERTYIEEVLPIKISYYEKYFFNASLFEDLKIIYATFVKIFYRPSSEQHELF